MSIQNIYLLFRYNKSFFVILSDEVATSPCLLLTSLKTLRTYWYCTSFLDILPWRHSVKKPKTLSAASLTDQYADTKLLTRILFRPPRNFFGDLTALVTWMLVKTILNRFKKVSESDLTHFSTEQMKYLSILESADLQKRKH